MFLVRIGRWSALAITFGLFGSAARAEMITPNSIPNPPSAVSSTDGTFVYSSNVVSNQYASLGLQFSGSAIAQVNGVSVWVPTGIAVGAPASAGAIYYGWGLSGKLVSPGSSNPTTVSSLSVEVIGAPVSVSVSGLAGQTFNIKPVVMSIGNVQYWTFTDPGISGFTVSPASINLGAWGVSEVSFTPTTATTPDPSSFVLAALGALGMVGRFGWRRLRAVVA